MAVKKRSKAPSNTAKDFGKFLSQTVNLNNSNGKQLQRNRNDNGIFNPKFISLIILWCIRLLVVFFPQYGYIQPDEFFQFTEPIAGDFFSFTNLRVWEFNGTASLRNMFFPGLISLPIFHLIKSTLGDEKLVNVSSYLLLVGPRFMIAILSFVSDFCIYRLCRLLYSPGPNCKSLMTNKSLDCLLVHASSYLAFTYYTHTFSNTIETILFGLLLMTIIESFPNSFSNSPPQYINIKLSLILAFGFFNRPTFVVFSAIPVLYWLACFQSNNHQKIANKQSRSSWYCWSMNCFKNIVANGLKLFTPFTLATMFLILVDTCYHHRLDDLLMAISQMSISKISHNLVLTPINFLVYNIQTNNLANHGLHPFWFHALVCMPWMFSLLAIIWYMDIVHKIVSYVWIQLPRNTISNWMIALLYTSSIVSLIGFSSRPHHEPRFLLPLIIPIVCLFGHRLFSFRSVAVVWFVSNLLLTIFYGHIHQAGVVASISHLQSKLNNSMTNDTNRSIHFMFARQYLPPLHLLTIPKQKEELFQVSDLAILEFPSKFEQKFRSIRPNTDVYLSLPSCLSDQLKNSLEKNFPNITMELVYQHFPHFTSEDLEHSYNVLFDRKRDSLLSIGQLLARLRGAFSMNVWKFASV